MPIDLSAALPELLPRAAAWAERTAAAALREGRALDPLQVQAARAAGVRCPHRVRLVVVPAIPVPDDEDLRAAAGQAGLLGPDSAGLALGYAVFLRRDAETDAALLRHELRHVHQFECYGSIKAFLSVYLPQVVQFGYADSPMEIDARRHAQAGEPDGAGCTQFPGR
jgi:hypothetical protein